VDGRADDGTRVRPGFYWARLTDANGSVVRRVAWLAEVSRSWSRLDGHRWRR
jgi:hypothetical protein